MRAEFVPEWASPVSRVMRAAFWPQRVHPMKSFSNPPLATRLSAALKEPARNVAKQLSKTRSTREERKLPTPPSAAAEGGKFDTGTGSTPEASRRIMRAE